MAKQSRADQYGIALALVSVAQKLCRTAHVSIKMDERLIELVRGYPVLYDTNDASYMKTKFKQEIWKKIGIELKMTDGK